MQLTDQIHNIETISIIFENCEEITFPFHFVKSFSFKEMPKKYFLNFSFKKDENNKRIRNSFLDSRCYIDDLILVFNNKKIKDFECTIFEPNLATFYDRIKQYKDIVKIVLNLSNQEKIYLTPFYREKEYYLEKYSFNDLGDNCHQFNFLLNKEDLIKMEIEERFAPNIENGVCYISITSKLFANEYKLHKNNEYAFIFFSKFVENRIFQKNYKQLNIKTLKNKKNKNFNTKKFKK